MKKISHIFLNINLIIGFIAMIGSSSAFSKDTEISEGSSCEGIDPKSAKMHCNGAQTLFCSSVTKYKYIVQHTCPKDQVCELGKTKDYTNCVAKPKDTEISEGSSCEGIDPKSAKMHCNGAQTLFCSSVTKYKYIVQHTCPENQVCELGKTKDYTNCVAKE